MSWFSMLYRNSGSESGSSTNPEPVLPDPKSFLEIIQFLIKGGKLSTSTYSKLIDEFRKNCLTLFKGKCSVLVAIKLGDKINILMGLFYDKTFKHHSFSPVPRSDYLHNEYKSLIAIIEKISNEINRGFLSGDLVLCPLISIINDIIKNENLNALSQYAKNDFKGLQKQLTICSIKRYDLDDDDIDDE
jgi:hypothetical protein